MRRERQDLGCMECGGVLEHGALCPYAPEPDAEADGEPVRGTIAFAGDLVREVRDAA